MTDGAVTQMEPRNEVQSVQGDPFVNMIERVVMSPDADLDKLERMLAMKERMEAQNARVSFARALSEARAEIPPIMKDATVDFETKSGRTTYRHETLAGIAKVVDPILSRFGLSYRFRTDQGQGGVRVTCIVTHSSGHYEETSLSGSPDGSGSKNSFQAVGSAVTYLQRYTLKAALGLSAEVDDDGQGASPRGGEQSQRDETQRRDAGRTYEKAGADPEPQFNPRAAADRLISAIRKRKDNRADLSDLWTSEKAVMAELPDDLFAEVKGEFSTAMPKADPAPNADLGGDEIPY